MGEMVEIRVDGGNIEGYMSLPQDGNGTAVLLLHAWWGLNDFFKSLADRLAREGFVVLAPDLYRGSTASTIEDAERLVSSLDYKLAIKDVEAAMDHLLRHPATVGDQIAVVGFSMGAAYATWLSTLRSEVRAVALFYGGAEWGEDFALQTRAAFLGHFAENDPYESADAMRQFEEQLHAAGKEVAFHVYPGTGHWFFEHDRPDAHNEEAAGLAWQRTLEFLRANLA